MESCADCPEIPDAVPDEINRSVSSILDLEPDLDLAIIVLHRLRRPKGATDNNLTTWTTEPGFAEMQALSLRFYDQGGKKS